MNHPVVTIALPIYNVEKYLDRCIESLVNQTYKNLEIILVDDCSPDGSARICDEWAKRDARIKVIHKKVNEGQGVARNDAMDIATGEYICFFDSDDYIGSDMAISTLVEAAERERAEIVVFGLKNIASDGTVVSQFVPKVGTRTYCGREVQDEFLPEFVGPDPNGNGERLFYMAAWLLMYSMKKIRESDWRYVSERKIISEDVYSLMNLFDTINTVTVVPEAYYCYCANDSTSFSRKYTPNRYDRIKHFYQEIVKLCQEKKYSDDIIKRIAEPYLSYTMATLKQEAKAPISFKERRNKVYSILKDPVLQRVVLQKKGDYAIRSRRLMYFLIRNKCYFVCYLLCVVKK